MSEDHDTEVPGMSSMLATRTARQIADDNDIAMAIGLGSRRKDDVVAFVVKILQENAESLQEVEEEKFRIEEEKRRTRWADAGSEAIASAQHE